MKWLLQARADAEKPVEADLTPLRLAARFGNDEVVEAGQPAAASWEGLESEKNEKFADFEDGLLLGCMASIVGYSS